MSDTTLLETARARRLAALSSLADRDKNLFDTVETRIRPRRVTRKLPVFASSRAPRHLPLLRLVADRDRIAA